MKTKGKVLDRSKNKRIVGFNGASLVGNSDVNITRDIHINEFKLKREWLQQPVLVMQYSTLATETRRERDLAARKVKVRHAKLSLIIRDNPKRYLPRKAERLTEAIVEANIEADDEYCKLQKEYIDLEYEYQMWRNVVDSLSDKKKSLEEIQELYMRAFYGSPTETSINDFKVRKKLNKKGGKQED